jgi:hypothetical protein
MTRDLGKSGFLIALFGLTGVTIFAFYVMSGGSPYPTEPEKKVLIKGYPLSLMPNGETLYARCNAAIIDETNTMWLCGYAPVIPEIPQVDHHRTYLTIHKDVAGNFHVKINGDYQWKPISSDIPKTTIDMHKVSEYVREKTL